VQHDRVAWAGEVVDRDRHALHHVAELVQAIDRGGPPEARRHPIGEAFG
jgi:hypothetical protein